MRITCLLCGLSLLVAFAVASPVPSKDAETDDLSPLNEVYLVEMEDDQAADGDRSDREKRKIGVVKLGVSNGIINFVFGKLDALLDAKTKALASLDVANKIKNAAYGIDAKHSATQKFIGELVAAKTHAVSGSIGPVINSATTFLSSAKSGLAGAFVSKLAPLSSLSKGLLAGGAAKVDAHAVPVVAHSGGSTGDILGGILSSKLGSLSALSQSKAGAVSSSDHAAGVTYGGNISGGGTISTTTEDIPEFDRNKVSLYIPPPVFGNGFTIINSVSKILNDVILGSARRTQTVLEVFKPFFRGAFAIKGLPSDDPN